MKNLIYYNDESLGVYQTALARKRDDLLRARLHEIFQDISSAFESYDNSFQENQLETIIANPLFDAHREDLACLYKFSSYIIRKVKKTIDDLQQFPLSNTCQNCTINSVNSMDHVLGQALFPQYSVHPLNLFPSCSECNGYKSASFARNGQRRFLNLYNDVLPDVEFLFVNIFINDEGDLDYKFVLENINNIDNQIFNLIENHYSELNLYDRMKIHSIKYYGELRVTIQSRLLDLSWDRIVTQITREAEENMQNLGRNHFEYVLQKGMVANDLFRQSFI